MMVLQAENEVFTYKSSNVLVQSSLEVPVIIQWPHSVIDYEFVSNPSSIEFGIIFVTAPEEDREVEDSDIHTVLESALVDCNSEAVRGSFEVTVEGMVFFLWDNTFDWTALKQVSYRITVHEPSFSTIDKYRTKLSKTLLRHTVQDLDLLYSRFGDAEDCIAAASEKIDVLEDQIALLRNKLDSKSNEYLKLTKEADQCQYKMLKYKECRDGLGIRCVLSILQWSSYQHAFTLIYITCYDIGFLLGN